jgi:orotate phosphoribosyltransferase
MTDSQLAVALKQAAYLEGDFVLRSGRRSKYYLDKYLFETRPDLLRALAARFAARLPAGTTRIAGAELGAVALATATSLETGLPFVIVRNAKKADYGTGKLVEGRLEKGERVMLVEDIVTSGGQVVEAAAVLRGQGVEVAAVVAVIDRQEGGADAVRKAGLAFSSIFTSADLGIAANKP